MLFRSLSVFEKDSSIKKKFEDSFYNAMIKESKFTTKFSSPKFEYYSDSLKISFSGGMVFPDTDTKLQMRGNFIVFYLPNNGNTYLLVLLSTKDTYKTHYPEFYKAARTFYVYPE